MFEHLDDPEPFVASESLRTSVVAAGGRIRRRRRTRLVGGGAVACAVALVAGGWAYVERRDAAIDRVDVATQPSVDGAVNVLLVGLDVPEVPADGVGARADSLAVVRLGAGVDGGVARVVSVPRDLVEPTSGRRLAEVAADGVDATVAGVSAALGGAPIDHVIELGFDGFVALVDAIGGVPVSVTSPLVDATTGIDLAPTDCVRLDGMTALGLARSRHIEGDPTGDLGRIARQQVVVLSLAASVSTADLDGLSRVLADHAVVDAGLTLDRMVDLGRRAIEFTTLSVGSVPVVSATRPDGAAVLVPGDTAPTVFAAFGGSGDVALPPDVVVDAPVGDVLDPGIAGAGADRC